MIDEGSDVALSVPHLLRTPEDTAQLRTWLSHADPALPQRLQEDFAEPLSGTIKYTLFSALFLFSVL